MIKKKKHIYYIVLGRNQSFLQYLKNWSDHHVFTSPTNEWDMNQATSPGPIWNLGC